MFSLEEKPAEGVLSRSFINEEYVHDTQQADATSVFMTDNYRWEKIGLENTQNFQKTKHPNGCFMWHQLPGEEEESAQSSHLDISKIISSEILEGHVKTLRNGWKCNKEASRAELAMSQNLIAKATGNINNGIVALTQLIREDAKLKKST